MKTVLERMTRTKTRRMMRYELFTRGFLCVTDADSDRRRMAPESRSRRLLSASRAKWLAHALLGSRINTASTLYPLSLGPSDTA